MEKKIVEKILVMIFCICMINTVLNVQASSNTNYNIQNVSSGENVIYISNVSQLIAFSTDVNNGNNYKGKTVKLTSDIYFDAVSSANFSSIGSEYSSFCGTFDGCGHSISGLTKSTDDYIGLFGYIEGANIYNIKLKNIIFQNDNESLAGIADVALNSLISDCSVSGNISSGWGCAGIVRYVGEGARVLNCSNYATLSARSIGGIASYIANNSNISNCYNIGTISCQSDSDDYCGGIAVVVNGVIFNCYNVGIINCTNISGKGGLVGDLDSSGVIQNCYYLSGALSNEAAVGDVGGIIQNVNVLSSAQMKASSFVDILNSNRLTHTEYRKWTVTAEYPGFSQIYSISLIKPNGGVISADFRYACAGDIVTIVYSENSGYKFSSLEVRDNSGTIISTTKSGNSLKFSMPSKPITVTAKYKGIQTISATNSVYNKSYGSGTFNLGAKTSGNGTLTYQSSNSNIVSVNSSGIVNIKNTGKAIITITANESSNYLKSTKKVSIIISPKKSLISSVKSTKKNTIFLKWKKDTMVTGYQIQYSLSKNFKSKNKTLLIKNMKLESAKISKLQSKKTYYIRIRGYKMVDGKKVFGSYSALKKVKVK